MNRFQHRIKDNKGNEFPYHFIFFDTETYQRKIASDKIEQLLRLGVAIYWRRADTKNSEQIEYFRFTNHLKFWEWVMTKCHSKRRIIILSHNLPFDMGIVKGFRYLDKMDYVPTKIILDFNCNIWKFRKDNVTLLFLDNMNYFPVKLEDLGVSIGVAKLPMPDNKASIEQWYTYCTRDVDVLLKTWQLWSNFLHDNDLGCFGYTLASQSFNAYRHRFMHHQICVHNSNKAIALERESYRGGRNECFRIGHFTGEKYYLLDVNSMYPYVMAHYEYPNNLLSTGKVIRLTELSDMLKNYCVIAECMLRTNENCYGVKRNGKLMFGVGTYPAVLTTNELRHALQANDLLSVTNFAMYDKAKIFTDYVLFFYNERLKYQQSGNTAFVFFMKRMLNSLYGKFGQKIENWEYVTDDITRDYDCWHEYDYQLNKVFTYRCINHRVEVSRGHQEGYNSLVAISSEVTANARLLLHYIIKKAGTDNVYYCDTDSVIVNKRGYDNLKFMQSKTELGMLKLESTTTDLIINNLKDYSFGGKIKIKGINKNAEMISYNKYKMWQSLGIKSGLHMKDINRVIWRTMIKTLSREYTKGIVTSSGIVVPFTFTGS